MMKRKVFLTAILSVVLYGAFATDYPCTMPEGYYSAVNGKSGEAIRVALSSVIANHTNVGYDGLYDLYQTSDVRADGSIWDMYSDCNFSPTGDRCGSYNKVCSCFNREHSLPKSWWGGNKATQYSDAFHLVPTDGYVNNQRSNYPFGECEGGERLSSKARGRLGSSTFSGYSGTVFEPDDEYKGDFARGYMYMLCAYKGVDFTKGNGSTMFYYSDDKSFFTTYAVSLLMKWHREDPVSRKELNRNEAIYAEQKNRNPFIDYPCLAEYIWGDHKTEAVDLSKLMSAYDEGYFASDQTGCFCAITDPTITSPKNGTTFSVGAANLSTTTTNDLTIKGVLLTQNVTLSLSGANASYFSLSTTSILPTENGVVVTISYTPTTTGVHTATLSISSPEANDVAITLTGSCITELTSPSSSPLSLIAENIGESLSQKILIKGTNLTSPISLTLDGDYISYYELSEESVAATDAMAGYEITLTYTPTTIGHHTISLVISGDDFTPPITVPINGSCLFSALPATNLTENSFIANWTNAGVTNYMLNVYTKETTGGGETLLFEEPFDNKNLSAQNASLSGKTYWDNDTTLRLGTGSGSGSVVFSGNNLSNGGRIVLRARYYNTDSSAKLTVEVGNETLQTITLTSNFTTYEVNIPANESNTAAKITLSSQSGSNMRVWVANLKVYTGSTTTTLVPVTGYPRSVGNVISYLVQGIDLVNNQYYYTVTPLNHEISEEIEVSETFEPNAIPEISLFSFSSFRVGNVWHISGIAPQSVLTLVNASGIILEHTIATSSEMRFDMPTRGIYILKINNSNTGQTLKMVY